MSKASELGKKGEALAAEYLINNGYLLLDKNFGKGIAEVDIVASRNDKIVFVEVKTRESGFLNDPGFMVPLAKQNRIIKAAHNYIKLNKINLPPRFDIISIVLNPEETKIEHYEGAFYPGVR